MITQNKEINIRSMNIFDEITPTKISLPESPNIEVASYQTGRRRRPTTKQTQKSKYVKKKKVRGVLNISNRMNIISDYISSNRLQIPSLSHTGDPKYPARNILNFINNEKAISKSIRKVYIPEQYTNGGLITPSINTGSIIPIEKSLDNEYVYLVFYFSYIKRGKQVLDSKTLHEDFRSFTSYFPGLDEIRNRTKVSYLNNQSLYDRWESSDNVLNLSINFWNSISAVAEKNVDIINTELAKPVNDSILYSLLSMVTRFTVDHYDILFTCSFINYYSKLKNKNVSDLDIFDVAMGWFDKASASGLSGCRSYTGFDPNSDLHPIYKEIVSFLQDEFKVETNFNLFDRKYEEYEDEINREDTTQDRFSFTADIRDSEYDIIFLSPPYYNKEIYSSGQESVTKYRTFEGWFEEWLIVVINYALERLKVDGMMVITVDNSVNRLHDRVRDYITSLDKFRIYGSVFNGIQFNIFDTSGTSNIIVQRRL